jgi:hypothetical protein
MIFALLISTAFCAFSAYILGKFRERRRVLLIIKKMVWDKDLDTKALQSVNRLIDSIQGE